MKYLLIFLLFTACSPNRVTHKHKAHVMKWTDLAYQAANKQKFDSCDYYMNIAHKYDSVRKSKRVKSN